MAAPTVLVLDGEHRAALAVVRSLGHRGAMVHVGASVSRSLAGGSRFATTETLLPDPLKGDLAYTTAVGELVARCGAQVVMPVAEASTLALLECPLATKVLLPTSTLERFRQACDKAWVLQCAKELGIDVPGQWFLAEATDPLPELPPEAYPLVIKPSRSVVNEGGGRRKMGVQYANNRTELSSVLSGLGSDAGSVLLQRRIEGPGLGVFLLRWDGRVLASFAHRRIREKPPSGGVSVCCESAELSDRLKNQSIALLEALDWSGVAMVEFKRDQRTGREYLMEVNPRFWGSLQLAIDAGVDFPWYLLQAALGFPVTPVEHWRFGIRSRWFLGEMDHLITLARHSAADLHLPADAPGLLTTAFSVLLPWRPNQRAEICRLSDPVPAWREAVAWVRALRHG